MEGPHPILPVSTLLVLLPVLPESHREMGLQISVEEEKLRATLGEGLGCDAGGGHSLRDGNLASSALSHCAVRPAPLNKACRMLK